MPAYDLYAGDFHVAESWDESQHPRDRGRFAHKGDPDVSGQNPDMPTVKNPGKTPGESSVGAESGHEPDKTRQVDSQEFRQWFGGSRVVDRSGQPLVVYHGTLHPGFEQFQSTMFEGISGHFAVDPKLSNLLVNVEPSEKWGGRPGIYPVYLSVQNPLDYRDVRGDQQLTADQFLESLPFDVDPQTRESLDEGVSHVPSRWLESPTVNRLLRARGYDGVVYHDLDPQSHNRDASDDDKIDSGESWIVFDPKQVKSAIGNSGRFDPTSSKISESWDESQHPRDDHGRFSQTDTPAFKQWFAKSQVVDEQGRPLVLYRGTRAPDGAQQSKHPGRAPSYTALPDVASIYSARPQDGGAYYVDDSAVSPVYVRMEKPLVMRNLQTRLDEVLTKLKLGQPDGIQPEEVRPLVEDIIVKRRGPLFDYQTKDYGFEELLGRLGRKGQSAERLLELAQSLKIDSFAIADSRKFSELAQRAGYDGAIHKDTFKAGAKHARLLLRKDAPEGLKANHTHLTWRPFAPEQVKSASGNSGQFDLASGKLTESAFDPDKHPRGEGGRFAPLGKQAITPHGQDEQGLFYEHPEHGKLYLPDTRADYDKLPLGTKWQDIDSGAIEEKQPPRLPQHHGPSDQAVGTLAALRTRLPRKYQSWLKDSGNEDEPESVQDYLREEQGIEVGDDGLVAFDRLTPTVQKIVGDQPVVVLHHTSDAILDRVQAEGLRPAGEVKAANSYKNSGAGVYVTTETGGPVVDGYSDAAVRSHGGNPITLRIKTTLDQLTPDPDDEELGLSDRQFILPRVRPEDIVNLGPGKVAETWDESKHPRDRGRFAHAAGAGKQLKRQEALLVAKEIGTGTGKIAQLAVDHPELRQASIDAVRERAGGSRVTLFRTLQIERGREVESRDGTASLTDRLNSAVRIGSDMPGMVMTGSDTKMLDTVLVRYDLDVDQVVADVRTLFERIPTERDGTKIVDARGNDYTLGEARSTAERESEVVADLTGQQPTATLALDTQQKRVVLDMALQGPLPTAQDLILKLRKEHSMYLGLDDNLKYHEDEALQEAQTLIDQVTEFVRPAKQTESPEFRRWFGGSQVVDGQGKPLVVYHGTNRAFDAFDPQRQRTVRNEQFQGDGFFFTEDPDTAALYADAGANQSFDRETLVREMRQKHPGVLSDLLVNLIDHGRAKGWDLTQQQYGFPDRFDQWPEEMQEYGNDINEIAEWVEGSHFNDDDEPRDDTLNILMGGRSGMPDWVADTAVKLGLTPPSVSIIPVYLKAENVLRTDDPDEAKTARARGYDAVYYTGPERVGESPEWIVFEPSQIKSAIGNRGTFDQTGRLTESAVFDPSEHPRDDGGRFALKGAERSHGLRVERLRGVVQRREAEHAETLKRYPSRKLRDKAERQVSQQYLEKARDLLARSEGGLAVDGGTPGQQKMVRDAFAAVSARYPRTAAGIDRIEITDQIGWAHAQFRQLGNERWIEINPLLVTNPAIARNAMAHELTHAASNESGHRLPEAEEEQRARDRGERWGSSKPDRVPYAKNLPEFKAWFGQSKVVDDIGRPLVVYHATTEPIDAFDPTKTKDGGLHFGTAEQADERLRHTRPARFTYTGEQVMPVYLRMERPLRLVDDGDDWRPKIDKAKSQGYDGIVYLNRYEAIAKLGDGSPVRGPDYNGTDAEFLADRPSARDSYIVFDASQVKSATGNRGTFNPSSPKIAESFDESQHPRDRQGRFTELLDSARRVYGEGTEDAKKAIAALKAFAKSGRAEVWNATPQKRLKLIRNLGLEVKRSSGPHTEIASGVIYYQAGFDTESAFHEAGHGIFLSKAGHHSWTEPERGEWKALADAKMVFHRGTPGNQDPQAYLTRQTERYAELFDEYVMNNEKLQAVAPGLYAKIERLLDEHAPWVSALQAARKAGRHPVVHLREAQRAVAESFDPSEHPRGDDGRFVDSGTGHGLAQKLTGKAAAGGESSPEQPAEPASKSAHFQDWIKDTAIVNAYGKPLVVYHGGPPKDEFDPEHGVKRGGEYGIYLTPRRKYAEAYGRGTASGYYVNLKNPIYVENKGEISPRNLTKEDVDRLVAQGYDGIVSLNYADPINKTGADHVSQATEIVAFRNDQVRQVSAAVDEPPVSRSKQTETPEFQAWFKRSQVVDPIEGKPLVLYHGAPLHVGKDGQVLGILDEFDRNAAARFQGITEDMGMDRVGSWFSNLPGKEGAEAYSGENGAIYPVYLSIQNPWRVTFDQFLKKGQELDNWEKKSKAAKKKTGWALPTGRFDVKPLRKWLQDQGYDGIQFEGTVDHPAQRVWVALEPEQVKSATGNKGTFGPTGKITESFDESKVNRDSSGRFAHGDGGGIVLYHATSKQAAQDLQDNGIDSGSLNRRDSGFFGPGFYASAEPQNFYGKSLVAVELKPDAKVLDVGPLVPKEPQPFHQDFVDSLKRRILNRRPDMDPGKLAEIIADVTPGSPTFNHLDYKSELAAYARSEGFTAASFADGQETVILKPEGVHQITHVGGLTSAQRHKQQRLPKSVAESWEEDEHPRGPAGRFAHKDGDFHVASAKQTESEAFHKWFSGSQVVDTTGQPLVLYHGTNADFDTFNRTGDKLTALGSGYYFTPDPNKAEQYGDRIMPVYVAAKNLLDWDHLRPEDHRKIVDALNQIVPAERLAGFGTTVEKRIPLEQKQEAMDFYDQKVEDTKGLWHDRAKARVHKEDGAWVISWMEPGLEGATPENLLALTQEYHNNLAQYLGYDGVRSGSELVVFDKTQIKSASGNRGTFEIGNPRITESAAWDESEHPRDRGRFAHKPGDSSTTSRQTETPEFKRWFGQSKIVDTDGKPLRVYHGSGTTNIEEFLPDGGNEEGRETLERFRQTVAANGRFGYMNFRSGSFFSPDPDYAGNYTGENGGVLYPVYIRAENPIYFDSGTRKVTGCDPNRTPDALVMMENGKINEIAVIDPKQVKSASGNRGTFDDSGRLTESWDESEHPRDRGRFAHKAGPDSPEFRKWFGASKVADADGAPKVLYHGTTARSELESFDNPYTPGWHYFTDSPEYAGNLALVQGLDTRGLNAPARVYPVYVQMETPLDLRTAFPDPEKVMAPEFFRYLREQGVDTSGFEPRNQEYERAVHVLDHVNALRQRGAPARDALLAAGYDGLIFPDRLKVYLEGAVQDTQATTYLAFDSRQVKSASGNRGTYDANSGKINESAAEWDEDKHPRGPAGRFAHKSGDFTVTPAQAVQDYSTDHFRPINDGLRSGEITADNPIVSGVDKYLAEAPKRPGVTLRSFTAGPEEFAKIRSQLQAGEISDDAYTSTRKVPNVSDRAAFLGRSLPAGHVALRITGRSGVDISDQSLNPAEGEVLYPRGTRFRVDKYLETPGGGILAELTEVSGEPEKSRQIDTPQFRQWFGKSTVVDDQGQPLRVFHGTEAGHLDAFQTPSFFTESPQEASAYADITDVSGDKSRRYEPASAHPDIPQEFEIEETWPDYSDYEGPPNTIVANGNTDRLFYWDGKTNAVGDNNIVILSGVKLAPLQQPFRYNAAGNMVTGVVYGPTVDDEGRTPRDEPPGAVYPVYLSIQNPIKLPWQEANLLGKRLGAKDADVQKWVDLWKSKGFDGIETISDDAAVHQGRIVRQWIAFDPEQIKSASGNRGDYSRASPNLAESAT